MQKLTGEEIQQRLVDLPNWTLGDDGKLHRDYKRSNFKDALGFIVRIGLAAEAMDHHPEIFNVYSTVNIALNTHDADGITEKDFRLAAEIETLSNS